MACDELLTLPPTAELVVPITVSAEARPYLIELFQDLRRSGETAEEFVLRHLINLAVDHRRLKLSSQCQKDQATVRRNYESSLSIEQQSILSTLLP